MGASLLAEAGRGNNGPSAGPLRLLQTTHRHFFQHNVKATCAKRRACHTHPCRASNALLETTSTMRRHFSAPDVELARRHKGEGAAPSASAAVMPMSSAAGSNSSAYARDFSLPVTMVKGSFFKRAVKAPAFQQTQEIF